MRSAVCGLVLALLAPAERGIDGAWTLKAPLLCRKPGKMVLEQDLVGTTIHGTAACGAHTWTLSGTLREKALSLTFSSSNPRVSPFLFTGTYVTTTSISGVLNGSGFENAFLFANR